MPSAPDPRVVDAVFKAYDVRGLVPEQIDVALARATGNAPYDAAPGFTAAKNKINPVTAFDFVTTNDIIGGNSGSPVIDRAGTVIGAAFDGNIHSLGGNYGYDGSLNHTVVVSTAAVQEALEKIYPAPNLVAELRGRRR